jgi:hypothetical protein
MSWVREVQDQMRALRGARIEDASILEMALVECGSDGLPIFRHRLAPFIQAVRVDLRLSDGRVVQFHEHQTEDADFPLGMWFADTSSEEVSARLLQHPIYRIAPQPHIPRSEIRDAQLELVRDEVLQITLRIGDASIALRAGEVIEHADGYFAVCDFGGSTLIYLDVADVARTQFGEVISWR